MTWHGACAHAASALTHTAAPAAPQSFEPVTLAASRTPPAPCAAWSHGSQLRTLCLLVTQQLVQLAVRPLFTGHLTARLVAKARGCTENVSHLHPCSTVVQAACRVLTPPKLRLQTQFRNQSLDCCCMQPVPVSWWPWPMHA